MPSHVLSSSDLVRYGRHLLLPDIGLAGQERLQASSVLVIGAGGLGSPAALYLAAAGIGRLGIADDDDVSLSNLQRQVIYGTADVGSPKAARATLRLRDLNPGVRVEPIQLRIAADNAVRLVSEFDVVVDATDNFEARYVLADASARTGRPIVYGAVHGFEGQVSVFGLPGAPCYRCLFPVPPPPHLAPSCGEAGVLGAATGVVGSLQAVETIKLITGAGEPLAGRLLLIDLLAGRFETLGFDPDPQCPACGLALSHPIPSGTGALCATERASDAPSISAPELLTRLGSGSSVQLVDVRRPHEAHIASIGGRVIPESEIEQRRGELDPAVPVVLYCRSGVRSARAARLLLELGFADVVHLEGGLFAWAADVDPDLPVY